MSTAKTLALVEWWRLRGAVAGTTSRKPMPAPCPWLELLASSAPAAGTAQHRQPTTASSPPPGLPLATSSTRSPRSYSSCTSSVFFTSTSASSVCLFFSRLTSSRTLARYHPDRIPCPARLTYTHAVKTRFHIVCKHKHKSAWHDHNFNMKCCAACFCAQMPA